MKRGKKLLILSVLLLVVCGGCFLCSRISDDEETVTDTCEIIYYTDEEALSEISWTYGDEEIKVVLSDGVWTYASDSSFPLDENYIESMINEISCIYSLKTVSSPSDLSDFGLTEPSLTVKAKGSYTLELTVGNESASGSGLYASLGDGNVYIIDSCFADAFNYDIFGIAKIETLPEYASVDGIKVVKSENEFKFEYIEESGLAYTDAYTWFTVENGEYEYLDTTAVTDFYEQVCGLTFEKLVSYKGEDSSEYGLSSPSLSVSVLSGDNSFTLYFGNETEDGKVYCKTDKSDCIYLTDSEIYNSLNEAEVSAFLPTEVINLSTDEILSVVVNYDGGEYIFEKSNKETLTDEGDTEIETIWLSDGNETDFGDFLSSLLSFQSSGSIFGIEPEKKLEIGFTFNTENDKYPTVTLEFYQFSSDYCLVSLNGEVKQTAERADVVSLCENFLSLILE